MKSVTVDVEQASFNNTFYPPGTWNATISYGQHSRVHTSRVQGIARNDGTTQIVWNNANMTLEAQQNEDAKHLIIDVFHNDGYMCHAMVPLKKNTRESDRWCELKTSSGSICGHVKLSTVTHHTSQGPEIRSKGDPTPTDDSYYSGRPPSKHVPQEHWNPRSNVVEPSRPDRNGGDQYRHQVDPHNSHGAPPFAYAVTEFHYPHTFDPHQQHTRIYASEQQQYPAYPPPQGYNGQASGYGGGALYGASHPHGAKHHHAEGNQYEPSYPYVHGSSSSDQLYPPARSEFDEEPDHHHPRYYYQ